MDLVNASAAFLAAHAAVATAIGLWIALATLVNRTFWPKRPDMARAESIAHFILVDLPSFAAAPGYRTWLGRFGIPFFTFSAPMPDAPPPPKAAGYVRVDALFGVVALEVVLLIGTAIGLALVAGGCAGYKAPSYNTLATVVKAVDAAREQLPAACEAAQDAAVDAAHTRTEAVAAVLQVQARCDAALDAIEATARVARTARDAIKDFSLAAAAPSDVLQWAKGAYDLYTNLRALLTTLHINLPLIGADGGK